MTPIGVVETSLYVLDLERAERFYLDVLQLERIGREPGRHAFFRVGEASMLLLFRAESTLRGDHFPHHGASGPGHAALGITEADWPFWETRLAERSIPIEKVIHWPRGGRSMYFRDPDGNSLELITPRVWGLPSGW